MTIGISAAPLEFKALNDGTSGEFAGYGAVFGNTDAAGDVVVPGAFREFLEERKAAGRHVPMHLNHGLPSLGGVRGVGVWQSMEEDGVGLRVVGKISGMNTDTGRLLYERMRDGAVGGLSIGFKVRPGGSERGSGQVFRKIKSAVLTEVSLVDDPCNSAARVDEIKSAMGILDTIGARLRRGDIIEERELEAALREQLDLSRSQATALASGGIKSLMGRETPEGEARRPEVKALLEQFSEFAGLSLPSIR